MTRIALATFAAALACGAPRDHLSSHVDGAGLASTLAAEPAVAWTRVLPAEERLYFVEYAAHPDGGAVALVGGPDPWFPYEHLAFVRIDGGGAVLGASRTFRMPPGAMELAHPAFVVAPDGGALVAAYLDCWPPGTPCPDLGQGPGPGSVLFEISPSGELARAIPLGSARVRSIAVSRDGDVAITSSQWLRTFDRGGAPLLDIGGEFASLTLVAYASDGGLVVAAPPEMYKLARDGRVLWQRQVEGVAPPLRYGIVRELDVGPGSISVRVDLDWDGFTAVLDDGDGSTRWASTTFVGFNVALGPGGLLAAGLERSVAVYGPDGALLGEAPFAREADPTLWIQAKPVAFTASGSVLVGGTVARSGASLASFLLELTPAALVPAP
jgi:hypothetical protein